MDCPTFFQTSIEFRPTLQAQHDPAPATVNSSGQICSSSYSATSTRTEHHDPLDADHPHNAEERAIAICGYLLGGRDCYCVCQSATRNPILVSGKAADSDAQHVRRRVAGSARENPLIGRRCARSCAPDVPSRGGRPMNAQVARMSIISGAVRQLPLAPGPAERWTTTQPGSGLLLDHWPVTQTESARQSGSWDSDQR
jgi:hypothetical protein